MISAFLLTACGPATPSPAVNDGGVQNPSVQQGAPGSYPAPGEAEPAAENLAYPSPNQAQFIEWPAAQQYILDGQVTQLEHYITLEVVLTLKDGALYRSVAPDRDTLSGIKEQCGDNCAEMTVVSR